MVDKKPEKTKTKKANLKQVQNYTVYMDEVLGKGQYGQVCKARLTSESKNPDA